MSDPPSGTVTFLFTDIEGSTRLLQELGEAYERSQDLHAAVLRKAISDHNGVVIRTEGDSFFAVFSTPTDAVRAAAAAQRELVGQDWADGKALRVRMGMHTGEGRLGGDDYIGIDVNRAARLAAAAHGGQVVLSEATRALVAHALPEAVSLRDLGEHRFKDLAHPERVYQLVIHGLDSEFPALRSLDARPHNLPQQPSSFIGRREATEAVMALVRERRLVTLTGAGGTGKTRVALHVAERLLSEFPDGALFVDLSATTDPALVASAIAQAAGVKERPGGSPVEALQDHLRDLRVLVVLDNFEQVVEAAPLVGDLLSSAPGVRALVTSRVPLHLSGEQEFFVPPLELPDAAEPPGLEGLSRSEAVALFVERARSARYDFALTTQNAPAVAEICVRLDGLPLAIELAAARVKLLSPELILARLQRRLALLGGGPANAPARQRTLRDTIAWSYDLLNDTQRRLLARLSVFSGGASLDAVEAVCNPEGELGVGALEALGALVDQSLVRAAECREREPRFAMLETIREYAAERLDPEDARRTRRRHAEYFRALAEEAEPHFLGPDEVVWLDRFEVEHDNLRGALRWALDSGEAETGLRLGAALWRFWFQRGLLLEGRRWLTEALALPGATEHPEACARAHIAAGGLAYWQTDFAAARGHYEQSVAIYRSLEDRRGLAEALLNLGYVPTMQGDFDEAEPILRQALDLATKSADRKLVGEVTGALGYMLATKGAYPEASSHVEESIRVARELGNRFAIADRLNSLAMIRRFEGKQSDARSLLVESTGIFRELGNLAGIAMNLSVLSALDSEAGRHERAARVTGAASAIMERIGSSMDLGEQILGDPVGAARAAIGDEAVSRALEEGNAMDVDEAVAYALEQP